MKTIIIALIFALISVTTAMAADVALQWEPVAEATGYKLYLSEDMGSTWDTPIDVGNVTTTVYPNVPEDKMVLFRVGAYNTNGETVRTWSGAWYNKLWQPPTDTKGLGIN